MEFNIVEATRRAEQVRRHAEIVAANRAEFGEILLGTAGAEAMPDDYSL